MMRIRRALAVAAGMAAALALAACETVPGEGPGEGARAAPSVPAEPAAETRQTEVPTAYFLFFGPDSIELPPSELIVVQELVGLLGSHRNLRANIVGHRAADERGQVQGMPIDQARSVYVGELLSANGVDPARLTAAASDTRESVAEAAGGDPDVDRRVDVILLVEGG